LIDFAVRIIRIAESLPKTKTGLHIEGQLVRCGTSPAANYGEAQGAESLADFIHKMRLCLKELRETRVWLLMISRCCLLQDASEPRTVLTEVEELIAIFAASIRTSQQNAQ
jgi:four helix bundle protein